jgi:hypothetical protein
MTKEELLTIFTGTGQISVNLSEVIVGFLLCSSMAFLLKSFYLKYSVAVNGKSHVAQVIPILSSVVFLVIVVVKSSLALSLGLVGALSIVRFRTPIKEPEELIYLFFAIALGLGYGANQIVITTFVAFAIFILIYFFLSNTKKKLYGEFTIVFHTNDVNLNIDKLLDFLNEHLLSCRVLRYEKDGDGKMIVSQVTLKPTVKLDELMSRVEHEFKFKSVTIHEATSNL